ncbi:hypothetical protein [uncultured Meiothermus sp.]|jgi:hypothetical protein|uniref:hypothetical protein n=1 Tax=uncultured Meiothermus sp. TaxID=157471 RepID=UPI0026384952|nr:hypothetical protein [uncultured Meiothermus sp.]
MNLSQTPFAPLSAHLLDLLRQLEGSGVEPTLAGGFGLFLRREWIAETQAETLIQPIPEARSTEDFDLLLSLAVLADTDKSQALMNALDALGYEVLPSALRFQFKKAGTAWGQSRDVKIDLLAPLPPEGDAVLEADQVRVKRRKGGSPLHGRVTPEAILVEERRMEVSLEGDCPDGRFYSGRVWLPNPLTLYVMKLFAFRDREVGGRGGPEPDYARKHAADLYTLTALLRQPDYDDALELARQNRDDSVLKEARQVVGQYFADENSTGVLRVREQPNFSATDLPRFVQVLEQIFTERV